MISFPIIETKRLRIRPFTLADLDNIHNLNVKIGWVDENETPSEMQEHHRRYLEWNIANYWALTDLRQRPTGDRLIELKDSGAFVGACGIANLWLPMAQLPSFGCQENSRMQAEVTLMWAVLPELWGNGYAPEAAQALIDVLFEQANLQRVVATTEHDNLASQRVMEKVGMRVEKNPFPDPFWFEVVGIIESA